MPDSVHTWRVFPDRDTIECIACHYRIYVSFLGQLADDMFESFVQAAITEWCPKAAA